MGLLMFTAAGQIQPTAALTTTLLTSAAVLLKATFTAAIHTEIHTAAKLTIILLASATVLLQATFSAALHTAAKLTIILLASAAVLLKATFTAAGQAATSNQSAAKFMTTPLTSAAVLLKATFTAAGHLAAVLRITKSSSEALPILQMLICLGMTVTEPTLPAIPLPLTAGAAVQILYTTSMILLLKISTGKITEVY